MSLAVSCPRCGGGVRAPDLMHSEWRCHRCGPVLPLHVPPGISADAVGMVRDRVRAADNDEVPVPLWCPWPLPPGWTVTGVGWVGDERSGPRGTALVVSGPAPLSDGPADVLFVSEDLGVGLGNGLGGLGGFAGLGGLDGLERTLPHAKMRVGGHPTPLWAVPTRSDRSVYIGESRAMWLYVIAWPAAAGYVLADGFALEDLVEALPRELVCGAPSGRLHRRATIE